MMTTDEKLDAILKHVRRSGEVIDFLLTKRPTQAEQAKRAGVSTVTLPK